MNLAIDIQKLPFVGDSSFIPLAFEQGLFQRGVATVVGLDEVGRGPLAGPVVAGAALFNAPSLKLFSILRDSKKLSEKKRELCYDLIFEDENIEWAIASIEPQEIDEINILQASLKAMRLAAEKLSRQADLYCVDGTIKIPNLGDQICIPKGDDRVSSISAAAIMAKVSRDRMMANYAMKYPEYGFERHKGYGTKLHREAILEYGPTPIHRQSFLKNILT